MESIIDKKANPEGFHSTGMSLLPRRVSSGGASEPPETLSWASSHILLLLRVEQSPQTGESGCCRAGILLIEFPPNHDAPHEHWARQKGGVWRRGQAHENGALAPSVSPPPLPFLSTHSLRCVPGAARSPL